MKIVCDACHAKYSIADEKVRGKVFKIRCKKCSNIIVVRGGAGEGEAAAAQSQQEEMRSDAYAAGADPSDGAHGAGSGPMAAPPDAVWHLVIDQEQIGPITAEEVRERFGRGEVDLESYAWREGFADWTPLGAIDIFAGLGGGQGAAAATAAAAAGGEATEISAAAPHQQQGAGGDLFASAAAAGAQGDDAAAAAAAGAGGDLFGAAASDDQADLFGGQTETSADDKRMRGERNENSVLFSLNNLAALASDAPSAKATAPAASAAGGTSNEFANAIPGAAQSGGQEGSGLIDIRSMAAAYFQEGDKPAANPAAASPIAAVEPAFPSTQAAPVLLPVQPRSSGGNKVPILAGIIGLLVAVIGVGGYFALSGDDKPTTVAAAGPGGTGAGAAVPATGAKSGTPTTTTTAGAAAATPTSGAGAAATTGQAGSQGSAAAAGATAGQATGQAAGQTGTPAASGSGSQASGDKDSAGNDRSRGGNNARTASRRDRDRGSSARSGSRRDRGSSGSSGSSSGSSSSSSGSSSSSSSDSSGKSGSSRSGGGSKKCLDEVGCLLAEKPPACCSKYSGGSSGSRRGGSGGSGGSNANLPERPSRSDISSGIGKVRGRVSSCGKQHGGKGQVKVTVKVAPGGSVSDVTVKSSPSPALGNCVAGAVKRAKFSKSQKGATFTYPFVF